MSHNNQQLNHQPSPLSQRPAQYSDYSPTPGANLSKYNYDYAQSPSMGVQDQCKEQVSASHLNNMKLQQHSLTSQRSANDLHHLPNQNTPQQQPQNNFWLSNQSLGDTQRARLDSNQNQLGPERPPVVNQQQNKPMNNQASLLQHLLSTMQNPSDSAQQQPGGMNSQQSLLLQQQQQLYMIQQIMQSQQQQVSPQTNYLQMQSQQFSQPRNIQTGPKPQMQPNQYLLQSSFQQSNPMLQQQMLMQAFLQQNQQQQQPQQFSLQQYQQPFQQQSRQSEQPTSPLTQTESNRYQQVQYPQQLFQAPQIPVPLVNQGSTQNYQQLQENLNQYKKLVSYLESIESSKKLAGQNPMESNMHQAQQVNMSFSQQPLQPVSMNQFMAKAADSGEKFSPENYESRQMQEILSPKEIMLKNEPIGIAWLSSDTFKDQTLEDQTNSSRVQLYIEEQMQPAILDSSMIKLLGNQMQAEQPQMGYSSSQHQLLNESRLIDFEAEKKVTANNSLQYFNQIDFQGQDQAYLGQLINKSQSDEISLRSIEKKAAPTNYEGSNEKQVTFEEIEKLNKSENTQSNNQNANSSLSFARSGENTVMDDQLAHEVRVEEKPIVKNQMTFEQLLESRLQENQDAISKHSQHISATPKRDFLRKSSANHTQLQSDLQQKSNSKYKYYADNFQNSGNATLNVSNQNSILSSGIQSYSSPKAREFKRTAQDNLNSASKQLQQLLKSNQKQPKQQQQQNSKQVLQRPHSQQASSQAKILAQQNRSRQTNTLTSNNLQSLNKQGSPVSLTNPLPTTVEDEENVHEEERNSIAEFEMLEQQCIQKTSQPMSQTLQSYEPTSSERTKKNQPKVSHPGQISVAHQKQLDQKMKELDNEIAKFKKEYNKVMVIQKELESQQKSINKQMEEFEAKQQQDISDVKIWKQEQIREIEETRREVVKERQSYKEQHIEIELEFSCKEQRMIKDTEEYLMRIQYLEEENFEKNKRIDSLTDKEIKYSATQTDPPGQCDRDVNTMISGEIETLKHQSSITNQNSTSKTIIIQSTSNKMQRHHCDVSSSSINSQTILCKEETKKESLPTIPRLEEKKQTQSVTEVSKMQPLIELEEVKQADVQTQQDTPEMQEDLRSYNAQEDPQGVYNGTKSEDNEIPEEDEESDEDEYDLKFPIEYHGKSQKPVKMIDETTSADGKIQRFFENGKKEVIFSNGVKREVWSDGYSVVFFNNQDVKQTFPDQKIVYYFADAKTTQTTFPSGLQVFKFSNNQIEKHFVDGTKEISFPDGTIKCLFPDGEEESIFPDGTIQKIEKKGVRIIEFPSGQRDVMYPDGTKVREFPDGSVKKIYPDGKVEMLNAKPNQNQTKQTLGKKI